jgi:hypothetical protein
MVEQKLPKLTTRVRFSSSAPFSHNQFRFRARFSAALRLQDGPIGEHLCAQAVFWEFG